VLPVISCLFPREENPGEDPVNLEKLLVSNVIISGLNFIKWVVWLQFISLL
jgi:hypothetical protein